MSLAGPMLQRRKYLPRNLVESDYFLQYTPICAGARHTVYGASGFVLTDSDTASITDRSHALKSIRSDAGQDYAQRVLSEDRCHREHSHIHRGLVGRVQGKVGQADLDLVRAAVENGHVLTCGRDVHGSGCE